MTLGELIDLLKPLRQDACVYIDGPVRLFSGYKGGNYRMTRATRVWFSNVGECSDHGPTGIASRERDDCTVVLTYGLVEP